MLAITLPAIADMRPARYVILGVAVATLACGWAAQPNGTPIPASGETELPLGGSETAVHATAAETQAAMTGALPDEAILLLTPGSGSHLVDHVHIEGEADSTFEQTLVVEVVLLGDPETVLAREPVIIQAELGQRGPFSADLSLTGAGPSDQPGEVRVYATSPRDGGVTHLATTQVTIGSGAADVRPAEPAPERIAIFSPSPAAVVRGGTAHVEGQALASFEQTLVARIYAADGTLIGQAPITVQAADYGAWGPFAVDVPYTAASAGAGRISVLDPSPAFGQTLHLASVEIQIEP